MREEVLEATTKSEREKKARLHLMSIKKFTEAVVVMTKA